MNDKKPPGPHKQEKSLREKFTLRRAILSGTAGVVGAATALAKANKFFKKELKKVKKPKKSPHKD
jgi:hypothetical protein